MNRIWKHIIFLFGMCFMVHAEPYQLEGIPFQPATNVEIVWIVTVTNLPKDLWVYKVVPQTFSMATVSNLLSLSGLEPKNLTKPGGAIPDKDYVRFQIQNSTGRTLHCLGIAPNLGWIYYQDNSADYRDKIEPAPNSEVITKLAFDILSKVGIDRSQVLTSTNFPIGTTQVGNDPEVISRRSIVLVRKIGGIKERGFCFMAEYGSYHGKPKLLEFDLNWRNLLPYESHPVAGTNEMNNFIRSGRATIPPQDIDFDTLKHAKKLMVTTFFPLYYNKPGFDKVDYEYPFVVMDIVADIGDGQTISFAMNCPILSTNEFRSQLEK
jgi:hypothetical protein